IAFDLVAGNGHVLEVAVVDFLEQLGVVDGLFRFAFGAFDNGPEKDRYADKNGPEYECLNIRTHETSATRLCKPALHNTLQVLDESGAMIDSIFFAAIR